MWGCPSWCPSLQQQPACLSTSTQQVSVAVQQAVAEEIAHALGIATALIIKNCLALASSLAWPPNTDHDVCAARLPE